jgi:hypothetical protein
MELVSSKFPGHEAEDTKKSDLVEYVICQPYQAASGRKTADA